MPVEQITNVVSNVLYGIMVTNFFNGQPKPPDVQAKEILDVVFLGHLERCRTSAPRAGLGDSAVRPETLAQLGDRIDETLRRRERS